MQKRQNNENLRLSKENWNFQKGFLQENEGEQMILQNLSIIFIAVFCSYSEYMYLSQIENIGHKHLIISFSVLNLIKYLLYWYFGIYFLYFIVFLILTLILSRKLLYSLVITVLLFVISHAG